MTDQDQNEILFTAEKNVTAHVYDFGSDTWDAFPLQGVKVTRGPSRMFDGDDAFTIVGRKANAGALKVWTMHTDESAFRIVAGWGNADGEILREHSGVANG
jgi:hypothetical protein